jgi:hypothetical protein
MVYTRAGSGATHGRHGGTEGNLADGEAWGTLVLNL